jgi:hypothetical protein
MNFVKGSEKSRILMVGKYLWTGQGRFLLDFFNHHEI